MEISKAIERKAKFFLVSCEAVKERDGKSELWHVLVKYCDATPLEAFSLPVKGLFLIAIVDDITKTIEKIREVITEEKFPFIICKKITPIEQLIKSDFDQLSETLTNHLQKIPENVKWRITLNRRHTKLKRTDVINLIASHPLAPKGKVDLSNPDWDIVVEIFGEWLGVGAFKHDPIIVIK
jgi:tRNA(Ser,Leu) C12 N-acetylase TAN1